MSTQISAAADAARESARQDNGQFGTQHRSESDIALAAPATKRLDPFSPGQGACWKDPEDGKLYGVRVIEDAAAGFGERGDEMNYEDTVSVRRMGFGDDDRIEVMRGELTGLRLPAGEATQVDDLVEGDWVLHNGRITEVGELGDPEDEDLDGYSVYFTDLDESEDFVRGDTLVKVDCSDRYLSTEEGMAHGPARMSEGDFREKFTVVEGPDGDTFETVPDGTDVHNVWSQYEGETDDGRYDYVLVPGYASGAINYVVTEQPWDEVGSSMDEVNWN